MSRMPGPPLLPLSSPALPLLFLCFSLLVFSSRVTLAATDGALSGWKGAGSKQLDRSQPDNNLRDDAVLRQERDTFIDPFKVRQVSWEPRAFVYEGFLLDEECDHLISLAAAGLQKSKVADNKSGESRDSEVRTSSGTFLTVKDEIIERVEKRIADWTFLPPEHGEPIQVLRYQNSQKYDAHFDFFQDKINIQKGGHRYATVLMYLSDVEEGGETVLPAAKAPPGYSKAGLSVCAQRGIAVKPRKGDALLFYNLHLDGSTDEHSLHGGCPVLRGEKWSATKWIHVSNFNAAPGQGSGGCADLHQDCIAWALRGECEKNPQYMEANCRRACKKC